MAAKVSFDTTTKIITVIEPPDEDGFVDLDVKVDLYSDGKEDWISNPELTKFRFFMRAVGGDALPGSKALGATFFLRYGWRIRPYEASHTLRVEGNLYTAEGDSPYLPVLGAYTVMVISSVSSLVDSTVTQLTEIELASFGGAVALDSGAPSPTSALPGIRNNPVNTVANAVLVAEERGFRKILVLSDITLDSGDFSDGYSFEGDNINVALTLEGAVNITNCEFRNLTVQGGLNGANTLRGCTVLDLDYFEGFISQCGLGGTVSLSGSTTAVILQSFGLVLGGGGSQQYPVIDLGGDTNTTLVVRDWSGELGLANATVRTSPVSIDMVSGRVILEDTVLSGDYTIRGVADVVDNSGVDVKVTDLTINTSIRGVGETVWGHNLSTQTTVNSAAMYIKKTLGLIHENFVIDNNVFDSNNQLISSRVRIFANSTDAKNATGGGSYKRGGGSSSSDPEPLETYLVTAAWAGLNRLTLFKQVVV